MTKNAQHVCPIAGCPEIAPCPTHARPDNARWSDDRDPRAHYHFARAVIARDQACVRCGTTLELQAHHVRPGNHPSAGVTLCRTCHRELDRNAR